MVQTFTESGKPQHIDLSPADSVAPAVDLPERKAGGPADRLDWLVGKAPTCGNGGFKVLAALVKHSNATGTCWPSRDLLMLETGMSARALDRGIADLKAGGAVAVKRGRAVSTYQLSGGLNGWQVTELCRNRQPRFADNGKPRFADNGKQNPSSSEPKKEPLVTGKPKRVDAETAGVTTGVFPLGFEEEGATAWTEEGFAVLGTATVVEAEPERQCAAPPPSSCAPNIVVEWMERHCPADHRQPEAGPFALRMLRDYRAHWWEAPVGNRKGGWQAHMTPEMVVARYVDNAERWRKFRADLVDKLVRGGLPAMTAKGEIARESAWCNGCAAMTSAYDIGQVMKIGGRREVDGCDVCHPPVLPDHDCQQHQRADGDDTIFCGECGRLISLGWDGE